MRIIGASAALVVGLSACTAEQEVEPEGVQSQATQLGFGPSSGALIGCYEPVFGNIRAAAYTNVDALGTYRFALARTKKPPRVGQQIARWAFLTGTLRGTSNLETGTADHVQATYQRDGFLFTKGDVFTPENQECLTLGVQQLNFVGGTGRYRGLTDSTLSLRGTINFCKGDPKFGQVDLRLLSAEGELCFDDPDAN